MAIGLSALPPYRDWPSNTFGPDGRRLTVFEALNQLWDKIYAENPEIWDKAYVDAFTKASDKIEIKLPSNTVQD